MAPSGRVAELLKNAQQSPESFPGPRVVIQTKPSQITKANCDDCLRGPILAALFFRRKMCPRSAQGGLTNLAAHLTPRRPTCIFTRNLQVRLALVLRNPSVLSILQSLGATPRTAPVPPRRPLGLPQRRLAAPSALPRRQLSVGLVRWRTNLNLIDLVGWLVGWLVGRSVG